MVKRKIGISMDSEIHKRGVKLAKKYGTSFSEMLELLVHEALQKEEKFAELSQAKKEEVIREKKDSYNIIKIWD